MLGPNATLKSINLRLWSPKPVPRYKRNLPRPSIKPSDESMKEKVASHPNGDRMEEEEALLEEEVEMEEEAEVEEEATQHQDPQEAHQPEETRSLPDLTSLLTYDLFPALTMLNQWGNSPTSSMGTEPKQRRLSTNSTTTFYLTLTSQGSTPQLKRSP